MTYSLSVTGYNARNTITSIKLLSVPDQNLSASAGATAGGQQATMRTGSLVLCKGPDGGTHWYRFDAERSTPANPVLLYVGP